jgi:hypothetical protein
MSQENKEDNQQNDIKFEDIIEDNDNNEVKNNIVDGKELKKKKKKSFKSKLILIETIVLIIVLSVVYLYLNNQSQKIKVINESSDKLELLNKQLDDCNDLITEDQVNPDEYNYCNLLIRKFK